MARRKHAAPAAATEITPEVDIEIYTEIHTKVSHRDLYTEVSEVARDREACESRGLRDSVASRLRSGSTRRRPSCNRGPPCSRACNKACSNRQGPAVGPSSARHDVPRALLGPRPPAPPTNQLSTTRPHAPRSHVPRPTLVPHDPRPLRSVPPPCATSMPSLNENSDLCDPRLSA